MSLGPLMIGIRGVELTEVEKDYLRNPLIAGVILFSRNFSSVSQLEKLTADIHGVRNPPLLVSVDQEGGRVQRFCEPFTRLPSMRELGHRHELNPDSAVADAHTLGWQMAAELLSVGVDMSFAPVVDIDRGIATVIGDRAFDSRLEATLELTSAFVSGMKSAGMQATAKHFPTHAGALIDSHKALAVDNRDFLDLYDDLEPYRSLVAHGLASIMVAHVVFPKLDERPASLSSWWIQEQLRKEIGFDGAIISDDIGMGALASFGSSGTRAEAALTAGCDLVLLCNEFDEIPNVLRHLDGYSNPVAQVRLMRLRGRKGCPSWQALHEQTTWKQASVCAESFKQPPQLELEG